MLQLSSIAFLPIKSFYHLMNELFKIFFRSFYLYLSLSLSFFLLHFFLFLIAWFDVKSVWASSCEIEMKSFSSFSSSPNIELISFLMLNNVLFYWKYFWNIAFLTFENCRAKNLNKSFLRKGCCSDILLVKFGNRDIKCTLVRTFFFTKDAFHSSFKSNKDKMKIKLCLAKTFEICDAI